jgi:hypothetical protein
MKEEVRRKKEEAESVGDLNPFSLKLEDFLRIPSSFVKYRFNLTSGS